MKRFTLFVLSILFLSSFVFAKDTKPSASDQITSAFVDVALTVNNGATHSAVLHIGIDPTATDGKDVALGETNQPPAFPPQPSFGAALILPSLTDYFTVDYRNGDADFVGSHVHHLIYQRDNSAPTVGVTIDFTLPTGVTMNISDIVGGALIDVDFPTGGPQTFSHAFTTAVSELLITLNYDGTQTPVELTSFTASTNGSQVTLNWKTATETNNRGFEIERKADNNSWAKIGYVEGKGTTTETSEYTFVDKTSNIASGKLSYRLKQMDYDGTVSYSEVLDVELTPRQFNLEQNYPNPFNPTTTIKYSLPFDSKVQLEVYNALGQRVRTLVNQTQNAGYFEAEFNASNLPSGIYFSVLNVNSVNGGNQFKSVKKMMLIK
ncbi:MAG: T9SS type A sorting domain-containing protein [bacterium]